MTFPIWLPCWSDWSSYYHFNYSGYRWRLLRDGRRWRSPSFSIATDRSRARRCVEACVYGTLDFVGYPRFPAPVEFIAAVIAYYVHPVNIQTACLIMEGAEFTENIINGVERPVKAAELFAF